MKKLQNILLLITALAVVMVAAIQRDGKILGKQVSDLFQTDTLQSVSKDVLTTLPDGTLIVNTTQLGKNIEGYAGAVPLEIHLKEDKVQKIVALPNEETPSFFDEAKVIFKQWEGKRIDEAMQAEVDAVSGATYTSEAIIKNVQKGLRYATQTIQKKQDSTIYEWNFKNIAALVVVLMAALIPLFWRNRHFRTLQLLLNVAVLGFWCGTFLSWTTFVHYVSNGMSFWASLVPIVMLITAFVYPLLGKKNYYCTHVCPCGSIQDLAAKANKKKWAIPPTIIKLLEGVRIVLFFVLMALMLAGVWTDWVDYEVFSAFVFQAASAVVLLMGVVVLALSFFVARPYCRFVCPTGTFLKLTEGGRKRRKQ